MTLQPSSASSVGRSVVRRRLTVMLTMTTDDDSATHRPTSAAAIGSRPASAERATGDRRSRGRPGAGAGQQDPAVVAPQPGQVDLDPDLEQEQDDADVGEQLELVVVGDVAGRERREAEADDEVPDDRREPEPPREPAARHGRQQDQADLEDGRRGGVHLAMVPAAVGPAPP